MAHKQRSGLGIILGRGLLCNFELKMLSMQNSHIYNDCHSSSLAVNQDVIFQRFVQIHNHPEDREKDKRQSERYTEETPQHQNRIQLSANQTTRFLQLASVFATTFCSSCSCSQWLQLSKSKNKQIGQPHCPCCCVGGVQCEYGSHHVMYVILGQEHIALVVSCTDYIWLGYHTRLFFF